MTKNLRRACAALAVATAAVTGAASAHDVFPTEGRTTLTVSKAANSAFTSAGVAVAIPAVFPVRGGSRYSFHGIDDPHAGGQLLHEGTITLSKGYRVIALEDPTVTVNGGDNPSGALSVSFGGGRATIATLDLSEYEPSEEQPGFSGAKVLLTAQAAALLNETFGTKAFAAGLELGALTTTDIAQRVRFTNRGRTTVKLSKRALTLLTANDLAPRATGAARLKGASVRLPIAGGRLDVASFKGAVKHRGGLRLGAYRTGNYKLRYEGDRGFVVRSGLQRGLALFTVGFGKKTKFATKGAITLGKGRLHLAIEAARDLAPALGLKPKALTAVKLGSIDVRAPYVDLAR